MENQGQEPTADKLQTPGANAENQQDNGTVGKVEELPQWAQELVKGLRSEAAANRKAKKDAETAAEKAREKELAEQQAWKELAEQRATKLAELEAKSVNTEQLAEKLARYEAMVKAGIEKQLSAVPEPFKPLLAKLDLTEQMDWLNANAEKLNIGISGIRPAPKPNAQLTEVNKKEAQESMNFMVRNF